MPTIVTGQQRQDPSGLEKFLSTITGVAGAASSVANVINLPKSLRLEGKRVDLEQSRVDVAEGQLEQQIAATERGLAQSRLNDTTLSTVAGRNSLFDMAANNQMPLAFLNGTVDPKLYGAAVSLGDVPVAQREQARRDIATMRGQDITEITDRFVLSEENLQFALDQADLKSELAFNAANPELAEELRQTSREQDAGVPEGQTVLDRVRERDFDKLLANEMLRLDPINGELSGAASFAPTPEVLMAAKANGLDWPSEGHVIGPNGEDILAVMPQSFWDTYYRSLLEQTIASDARREQSTLDMAEEFVKLIPGMPIHTALAFATADIDALTDDDIARYAPIFEGLQATAFTAATALRTSSPWMANFFDGLEMVKAMGFPDDEMADAMEIWQEFSSRMFPGTGFITYRNVTMLDRLQNFLPGGNEGRRGPGSFSFQPGQGSVSPEPGGASAPPPTFDEVVGGSNRAPDVLSADMSVAFAQEIQPMLQSLVGETEGVINLFFEGLQSQGLPGEDGLVRIVTPDDIAAARVILAQLNGVNVVNIDARTGR